MWSGGAFLRRTTRRSFQSAIAATAVLWAAAPGHALTPPGTRIDNVAVATYVSGAEADTVEAPSNVVTVVTRAGRTPSALSFLRVVPWNPDPEWHRFTPAFFSRSAQADHGFEPAPVLSSGTLDPYPLLLPLQPTDIYHRGEVVHLHLRDLDQNLDPDRAETVEIRIWVDESDEQELLRLTETGPATGTFLGCLAARATAGAAPFDGVLDADLDMTLRASYVDREDELDSSFADACIHILGRTFDSRTGEPVSGSRVSLVDAAGGFPVAVQGDDPSARYPASVSTGATVRDDTGRSYEHAPGQYRFPRVAPGAYRLRVEPPPGYRAPSQVEAIVLRELSGNPFDLAQPGSWSEAFPMVAAGPLAFDIPLDPVDGVFGLEKTAGRDRVGIGEFVPYTLRVENRAANTVTGVVVRDDLPLGFRFRAGSARLNGIPVADPMIEDGRSLAFPVGDIPAGNVAVIRYVTEVSAGARTGDAVNSAIAAGDGVTSTPARATVRVESDFIDRAILFGTVRVGDCDSSAVPGPAGIRILLEDGSYTTTDERGRFHLEGVATGTHVVALDPSSLPDGYEPVPCPSANRFGDSALSQIVSVEDASLWRADFRVRRRPAPPVEGETGLRLTARPAGDRVDYEAVLDGATVPVENRRLTVSLAEGTRYVPGSSARNGAPIDDPPSEGGMLVYRLGSAGTEWRDGISFSVTVETVAGGDHPARAFLMFDTAEAANLRTDVVTASFRIERGERTEREPDIVLRPRFATFSADLKEEDRAALDAVIESLRAADLRSVEVTGHTDSIRVNPASRHIFADNYALSLARARSVAAHLESALGDTGVAFHVEGRGPDEPVADNRTPEGRQENRRVELRLTSERRYLEERMRPGEDSPRTAVTTRAPAAVPEANPERPAPPAAPEPPPLGKEWIESLTPGAGFLWPPDGYACPIPSVQIVVQHDPDRVPRLERNGREVSRLNFEGTLSSRDGRVAVSVWNGVDVEEGHTRFTARLGEEAGAATFVRSVHLSGPPVTVELVPEYSTLVADGRTVPVLAVRLRDRDGEPVRERVVGGFTVDPPHVSRAETEAYRANPLGGPGVPGPRFVVGPDGIAFIELDPTRRAGEATLRFPFERHEEKVRAWLTPKAEEWILVGLLDGTAGHRAVTGHMESLEDAGLEEEWHADGRAAFYAKGRVRGSWLLTLAYDSDGNLGAPVRSVQGAIDPDRYYTLYGDAALQDYDAPSARKLYLRLERRELYALFGDFETGLTVTELSRYQRVMNGFKSEYRGRRTAYTAFAAAVDSRYARVEIPGNGTSGLYALGRNDLMVNSERVTVEVRDRFRTEVVLSSTVRRRHVDYDVDYPAGTLFFRAPVPSKDADLNPVLIVVEYETVESTGRHLETGGRGAAVWFDGVLETGVTGVHENRPEGNNTLAGVDVAYRPAPNTELRAEGAWSRTEARGEGAALALEARREGSRLAGSAWYRRIDDEFGLEQQTVSERGTEKFGVDSAYRLDASHRLAARAFRQDRLSTEATRDVLELSGHRERNAIGLRAGFRHAADRFAGRGDRVSTQATAGADARLARGRLRLSADHEQSLGGNDANPDYPTRTVVGADLAVRNDLSLFAAQEFTHGDPTDSRGGRVGLRAVPWAGGELASSLGRLQYESGERVFANLGLKQTWRLGERWFVDAGLDHSRTLGGDDSLRVNPAAPPASGAGADFVAGTVGMSRSGRDWQWNARAEIYDNERETRWAVVPAVLVQPAAAVGLAAGGRLLRTDGPTDRTTADLRLSLSVRPDDGPWTLLNRLDLIHAEQGEGAARVRDRKAINNLHVNRTVGTRMQAAARLGAKTVGTRLDGADYRAVTTLLGLELRRDVGRSFDVGLHGDLLRGWDSGMHAYRGGVSVGHTLLEDAWLRLGYNAIGFVDEDLSGADYTAHGPYVRLVLRLDDDALRALGLGYSSRLEETP